MSNSDLIGREVTFHFSTTPDVKGEIQYAPVATGDCWQVTGIDSWNRGKRYYIQNFDFMEVHRVKQAER